MLEALVREAAKKSSSPNGQAIKALPPPSPQLNGNRAFFCLKIAENEF